MKRKNGWRWMWVTLLVAWALYEFYPPMEGDLIRAFQNEARGQDATFQAIVTRARELRKAQPERVFGDLLEAIGTNDIARYFPAIDVAGQPDAGRAILDHLQKQTAGKLKLGLDLRGGTSFLVGMDTQRLGATGETDAKQRALSQAVEVLRKRVDRLGVAEPIIQPLGENRILIALPGLSDADTESARRQIQKAAFLEFRMVHPESEEYIKQGVPVPGYEILRLKPKAGEPRGLERLLVKNKAERGLTGKNVKRAVVQRQAVSNEPEINFTLDDQGAREFAQITREYSPQGNKYSRLAIVLDGELYSAPRIMGEIPSGNGSISGNFDLKEAYELANVLENPLEAPVKILEERRVDPSLGKDSIRSGLMASVIGTAAVALFMLAYYWLAGLVANIALLTNVVILLGVMCSIGTTLTIPGIAGIVLTVGMAVDANVLIYERIREELAAGKALRAALAAGYDKAFNTIFDSHVTTLISSLILTQMGTGPVKGFGVTLTIGVALSLFTALVVTRLVFDALLAKGWLKSLDMLHLVKGQRIDFMRWSKVAFVASWVFIAIGCGYGLYRGKQVLGVDFAGGDNLTLSYTQKVETDRVREAVANIVPGESLIQYEKDLATGKEALRIAAPFDSGTKIEAALKAQFPQARFERRQLDKVGPSVGREIQKTAIVASLLSMLGILIYVAMRYEFSFAIGAVVAIVHDILLTIGCFCLAGRQFSAPMVAAVLTIIGFSVNDKVVIFDRIREDLKLGRRGTFTDLMNHALNRTLSRTIITSGTVFLATMSLYLFGGGVINDFAYTFLVGILTGTYSSIYIASALVLWWHKGKRPAIAAAPGVREMSIPMENPIPVPAPVALPWR